MADRGTSAPAPESIVRVRVFVDFWNFQLSVNRARGRGFRLDWKQLGLV